MYEFRGAPSFRRLQLFNLAQASVWMGIYGISFVREEIPLWWGAFGLTMSIAFGGALAVRGGRVVTEVAMYPDQHTLRIRTHDWLGRTKLEDVPLALVGPNPNPVPKSGASAKFWSLKLPGHRGYHLLDAAGEVFDLAAMNRTLGYDVRTTVQELELHLSPAARQQIGLSQSSGFDEAAGNSANEDPFEQMRPRRGIAEQRGATLQSKK